MEKQKGDSQNINQDIEIYNRESSEILQDIPQRLLRTGRWVIYGITSVVVLGCACYSYSTNRLSKSTGTNSIKRCSIAATKKGVIDSVYIKSGRLVNVGDTIATLIEK